MEVFYNGNILKDGQFLTVSESQIEPEIKLSVNPSKLYTLFLYDPDAVGGTYIHWTKTNISNNDIKTGNIIIPYKGPAPPPKTGNHRYIFHLYQQNGVNKMLPLEERAFELNDLENKLEINDPIFKIQFISANESGGKKSKRNKNGLKNRRTKLKSIKNRKSKRKY
jgi:phosphatidylethanolamine-binding protein (PEBP) family uncharacterized protein